MQRRRLFEGPELAKRAANFTPLTPLAFLSRAEAVFAGRPALSHGTRTWTYAEFAARCRRLAHALERAGVTRGDTVAILAPNGPAVLEAHYAVPMLGAVLNPINTRLDARSIAHCLAHGEAKVIFADRELADTAEPAIQMIDRVRPLLIDIADEAAPGARTFSHMEYEAFLARGEPDFAPPGPADEWDAICLLYTSGTTGNPKGAVYSHRGAHLNALASALTFKLDHESRYLWTLPMFHCSGWTYTWGVTAVGGHHVSLRKVEPKRIFELIEAHRITHLCGAPIVLNMLAHAPAEERRQLPLKTRVMVGGAAPPSTVIANMEALGFEVLHAYGTTESYGPSTACLPMPEWDDLSPADRHARMARQGLPHPLIDRLIVADPATGEPVPQDGATIGEVMLAGNTLMRGYLKNEAATESVFAGGLYRSGDLAVWHADGAIEVKDRSKDIIISGGENISSLEVEEVLYRHPAVMEAAVVARPDPTWGETPCAFIALKSGAEATEGELRAFCRDNLAGFKVPRVFVFGPLPKTATGKIQKFVLRERAQAD